jgi:hypothetical protein
VTTSTEKIHPNEKHCRNLAALLERKEVGRSGVHRPRVGFRGGGGCSHDATSSNFVVIYTGAEGANIKTEDVLYSHGGRRNVGGRPPRPGS